jgi:hypothetical protein
MPGKDYIPVPMQILVKFWIVSQINKLAIIHEGINYTFTEPH